MRDRSYFLYILMNHRNTTLYIGVTNDLHRRLYERKQGVSKGFSYQYNLSKLVYFEETDDITMAIEREKQLKTWKRKWKLDLTKKINPHLKDLSVDLF
ncbi:GIY-YIG nuclease family protein [Patescibacteria group bacterium]|nr:GIY-YIG nuclease family protein [Patescibacteria group bacterium]MBU1890552.1 GIY-YIG nuclease family protein [Patescibacteria group bacterium]